MTRTPAPNRRSLVPSPGFIVELLSRVTRPLLKTNATALSPLRPGVSAHPPAKAFSTPRAFAPPAPAYDLRRYAFHLVLETESPARRPRGPPLMLVLRRAICVLEARPLTLIQPKGRKRRKEGMVARHLEAPTAYAGGASSGDHFFVSLRQYRWFPSYFPSHKLPPFIRCSPPERKGVNPRPSGRERHQPLTVGPLGLR